MVFTIHKKHKNLARPCGILRCTGYFVGLYTAPNKIPPEGHKGRSHPVCLLFSSTNKLRGLCRRVNLEKVRKSCTKNPATPSVKCDEEVVYKVPLPWKKSYVGQTGRSTTGSMLAQHAKSCDLCEPDFEACCVSKRHRGQCAREICMSMLTDATMQHALYMFIDSYSQLPG